MGAIALKTANQKIYKEAGGREIFACRTILKRRCFLAEEQDETPVSLCTLDYAFRLTFAFFSPKLMAQSLRSRRKKTQASDRRLTWP